MFRYLVENLVPNPEGLNDILSRRGYQTPICYHFLGESLHVGTFNTDNELDPEAVLEIKGSGYRIYLEL